MSQALATSLHGKTLKFLIKLWGDKVSIETHSSEDHCFSTLCMHTSKCMCVYIPRIVHFFAGVLFLPARLSFLDDRLIVAIISLQFMHLGLDWQWDTICKTIIKIIRKSTYMMDTCFTHIQVFGSALVSSSHKLSWCTEGRRQKILLCVSNRELGSGGHSPLDTEWYNPFLHYFHGSFC